MKIVLLTWIYYLPSEVQNDDLNVNNNNNNQESEVRAGVMPTLVTSTPATVTNTNVLNNVPKSLFSNCNVTIGSINFYTNPN